ncbi:unnamed protein product [Blepharisma stoltei]|uniref:Uncharacterized protein n=1 Tax=Blepharisma stoltei TaxID=1481888 RepID=A0AAU9JH19_9CILI|nr:unnamed protein product [Blepharisma stoltei]
MAKSLLALIFLLAFAYSIEPAGKAKLEKLRALSSASQGMIRLNTTGYYHYIVDSPRPYIVVVYFTADVTKFKCLQCEQIHGLLDQVIYSYKTAGAESNSDDPTQLPVFFAEIEYLTETQEIFQKHEFMSAPNLFVSKPKNILNNGKTFTVKREDMWEFNMGSDAHAYKLLEFINNRSGRNIQMQTPVLQSLMMFIYMVAIFLFIATLVYKLKDLLLVPYMWLFGSILVYFVCISGVVYDIIHGVPMVGSGQKGVPELIHSGQRSQYGAEGFLMGFLITIGGLGVVALGALSKLPPYRIRLFGFAILLAVIYSAYTIVSVYRIKARWYGPGFYPPDYYTRGPLMRDQGYSF